jgi:hypothetical protein
MQQSFRTLTSSAVVFIVFVSSAPVLAIPNTPYSILLPNGLTGTVNATNEKGDVVGEFAPLFGLPSMLGFQLDQYGNFTDIGPSFANQFGVRDTAAAVDINNRGDIIGNWLPFLIAEPVYRGFLFSMGTYTNIVFPQQLDPCNGGFTGDNFTRLTSIANNGFISGQFQFGGYTSPCVPGRTPLTGTFLWRDGIFYTNAVAGFPMLPEPSSILLLGSGLLVFALTSQRRKSKSD